MRRLTRLNTSTRRQRALLTANDARRAGLSDYQVHRLVRKDQYRRIQRSVVVLEGAPPSWDQSVHAVALSAGPGVFVAGFTALRLYGCRVPEADVIEVVSSRTRRVRRPGIRAHRSLQLFDEDSTTRHGIPCTSAARSLVDVSSRVNDREFGRLVDDLLRRRLLRLRDLHRCAGRLGSAPGRSVRRVERALGARWPGYDPGDSDLETRVLRVLVAAGVPLPAQQQRIKAGSGRRYFDLAWPDLKFAVEIDSDKYHAQVSAQREDRLKGNEATQLGWWLVRVDEAMSDAELLEQVLPTYQRLAA